MRPPDPPCAAAPDRSSSGFRRFARRASEPCRSALRRGSCRRWLSRRPRGRRRWPARNRSGSRPDRAAARRARGELRRRRRNRRSARRCLDRARSAARRWCRETPAPHRLRRAAPCRRATPRRRGRSRSAAGSSGSNAHSSRPVAGSSATTRSNGVQSTSLPSARIGVTSKALRLKASPRRSASPV